MNNTPQTGKPINPAAISLEQAQVKLPKIDADAALNAKSREFLKNVLASPEAKKTIVRAAAKDSFGVDPGNDISPDFAKELADQIKSLDEKKGDKSGAELLSLEKLPSDLSNLKVEIAKAAMQRSFGKLDSDWSDPKTYEEAKDQLKNNAKDSAEVLNLLSRIEAEEKLRPAPVLKLINPAAVATDTDSKSDINPAAVANKNPINQDAVVSTVIPSDVLEKSLARLDNYMKADKSIYHDSATGLFNAIRKEYGAKGATELHEAYKEKFGISIGRSLDDIYIYEMNKPLLSAVYGTDVVSSMIKIKNIEKQWFTKGDTIELVNQLKKDGLLDKVREAWDEFTDVKRYPGLDFNSRVKYLTGSDDKQLRELLN